MKHGAQATKAQHANTRSLKDAQKTHQQKRNRRQSYGMDVSHPAEDFQRAPKASVVTDCKNACDAAAKTAVPNCVELPTQRECLFAWVHSKAMLASCLSKTMDNTKFGRVLELGKHALFDERTYLEHRAGRRQTLRWLGTQ